MLQAPSPFALADWLQLRRQKQWLVKLQSTLYPYLDWEEHDDLEGLIHFLDHLQDYAVDELGYSKQQVFGQPAPPADE